MSVLVLAALPMATPSPRLHVHGVASILWSRSLPPNATGATDTPAGSDRPVRLDPSNLLLRLTKAAGRLRASVVVGAYAFPVVGMSLNPLLASRANTRLYGVVPTYRLRYDFTRRLSMSAGQMPSLLGQESDFTYQNANVERGLLWQAENTFDRGLRLRYRRRHWSAVLGYNDGFYSGNSGRAWEGDFTWMPSRRITWQFAFLRPGANTPPNLTATVANKREYDLEFTDRLGKLEILPYVLAIASPASLSNHYTRAEEAFGEALLATYSFSARYSLALRIEHLANGSSAGDPSPNADLVGFGAGSSAQTWTLTPGYAAGPFFARMDLAAVRLTSFVPGSAFGSLGTNASQSRIMIEAGVRW